VTLPEPTQPGGASETHGPLSAAWNRGVFGSNPLPGPSWPGCPLGSGKFVMPFARMHLAKARLKLPEDCCPEPPPGATLPAMTFPPDTDSDAEEDGSAGPPPHAAALMAAALMAAAAARMERGFLLCAMYRMAASSAARRDDLEGGVLGPLLRERNAVTFLQHSPAHDEVMRVLLVEDHARLAMALAAGLRQAGMAVDVVFDGDDALEHAAITDYEVIVLDRDIPGVHGDDVCRQITAGGSPSRVLMLTAAGAVEDRVEGLGLGADDYLAKPCDFAELVARVRALARRPGTSLPPLLRSGDITLDPSRRVAARAGRRLPLNPKELAVLEVLLGAGGAVVSAEEILHQVWDEFADPFSQAVRTTVSRLRAKLGDPPPIETVSKAGYRISQ